MTTHTMRASAPDRGDKHSKRDPPVAFGLSRVTARTTGCDIRMSKLPLEGAWPLC